MRRRLTFIESHVNKKKVAMRDFSERFVIIYKKFMGLAADRNEPTSKLALSRFFGVSQGCMQNWERGKIPQPDDLTAIHDKLGFAYRWLITGEGDPFDENSPTPAEGPMAEKIARLEKELAEERELSRKLTTRLLHETGSDGAVEVAANVAKAAGQE